MDNEQIMEKQTLNLRAADNLPMIQLFVFQGEECLGWDCFCKKEITIGSGNDTDLQLSGQGVSDIHAVLCVMDGRLKVSYPGSGPDGICEPMPVNPLDSLLIGPYTIKAKMNRNGKGQGVPGTSLKETSVGHEKADARPDKKAPDFEQQQEHGQRHESLDNVDTTLTKPGLGMDELQEGSNRYNLIFEGRIMEGKSLEEVRKNLKILFKKDESSIERLFSGRKAILKRNADYRSVVDLQAMFEDTGALCSIERSTDESTPVHKDAEPDPREMGTSEGQCNDPQTGSSINALGAEEEHESPGEVAGEQQAFGKAPIREEDDDEDDEEEGRATFSLKERIKNGAAITASVKNRVTDNEILLEIVQSRNDDIIDVRFLHAQEKYFIRKDKGLFCLAENKGTGEMFLYLDDQDHGCIEAGHDLEAGHDIPCDLESFKRSAPGAQSRSIGRHEEVVIRLGAYEYLLRQTSPCVSPPVKGTLNNDKVYARHFGRSVIFHVIILVILGMMPTYKYEPELQDKGRFVQVDTRQLNEIKKIAQAPEVPKKPPEIVKLKEDQFAQKIGKRQITALSNEHRLATAQAAPSKAASSRASTSGGGGSGTGGGTGSGAGSGEGNVSTKNIHQAGLLSMLGDSIGIKPTDAMAAVTNLDAVSSPAENKAQFKVGGIVGKLGGGRIEIPKAGIVSTKGSSQVLRSSGGTGGSGSGGPGGSGGSGGPGGEVRVAALEKGGTGTQQVKAKVSAQLNKTVKVQGGGMSREEVKKIIDQHLDEITRCYETALVASPSLMGRVVFEWKILMSGKVGEVKIKSSTLNSTDIHSCIQASIKSWEFPQPEGSEVIVSYPFIFDIVGF